MCTCKGYSADCSGNHGRLTFIPRFKDHIRFLNFSFNNLTAIPSDDFFLNITDFTILDLSNNGLQDISPGAFRPFRRLSKLLLIANYPLTWEGLGPVLDVRSLTHLDLRHGTLPAPPADLFDLHPLPKLQTLFLHNNRLHNTNMSVFTPLRKLRNLGLSDSMIAVLTTGYFPELQQLNLDLNSIYGFPRTCRDGGNSSSSSSSLFPKLTRLLLLSNHMSTIDGEVCLPKLKQLDLQRNDFSVFLSDQFSAARFPSLVQLFVSSMKTQNSGIQKHAFRNGRLEILALMFNYVEFSSPRVDVDSFAGCPRMHTLQVSHNYFNRLSESKFTRLFSNLAGLQHLYIGNGNIQRVTAGMFAGFKSLRKLVLYQNQISGLPDAFVDRLANLTELDVSSNGISAVQESTFSPSTRQRLRHLDLSGNPFACSCDLVWFRGWLVSDGRLFNRSWSNYTCKDRPRTTVASFRLSQQACLLSHEANVLIVFSVSFLLLAMTLACSLYRYRWHIRLLLHEAFRGRGGGDSRLRRLLAGNFEYDVFVSYASEDLPWVQQHLLPQLEGEGGWGLRLCLHQRDFIVGKNIADNISDSVEGSKKVLMVFSEHFCRRQWCQFELQFCLRHVLDFDDALVVTCVGDVESRDLTTVMWAVLKTTTYIQWEEHPDAVHSFWGRLRVALQDILPVAEV